MPYSSPFNADKQAPAIHLAWVVVLCTAWTLLGLLGHDPWKPDEAYGFGLVNSILQGGDWVVPMLAGEPFVEKPPLYYLTAAACAKLFSPWLAPHDGARLASGFYMVWVLSFTGLAARELWGKGFGRLGALIMIACLGLLVRTHQLITDVALLAGFCIALYGLALSPRRAVLAGFVTGTGAGIGFMAKGLLVPGVIGIAALTLPLLGSSWRSRGYLKFLAMALAAALPWLTVWPFLLYQRSPQLFTEWLWLNNLGRFAGFARLGTTNDHDYYLTILPWFAWPALPLAVWTLWRHRWRGWASPAVALPLAVFLLILAVLSSASEGRDVYALPLLPPLAVLAVGGLATLRRGAANALDWFGVMTFSLFAAVLWVGWYATLTGYPAVFADWASRQQPGFVTPFNGWALVPAVALTFAWLAVVFAVRRSALRSVVTSALGLTLVWGLLATIWLPWLDAGKSYRGMIASLTAALPHDRGCIASRNLGEPQRALLDYFAGIVTRRLEVEPGVQCRFLLTQGVSGPAGDAIDPSWRLIWTGSRLGDTSERFRLFERQDNAAVPAR